MQSQSNTGKLRNALGVCSASHYPGPLGVTLHIRSDNLSEVLESKCSRLRLKIELDNEDVEDVVETKIVSPQG